MKKIKLPFENIEEVENYSNNDEVCLVNYSTTELKNEKFLNYINNTEILCELDLTDTPEEEIVELLHSYVTLKNVVTINELNKLWGKVLKHYFGFYEYPIAAKYIEKYEKEVKEFIRVIKTIDKIIITNIENRSFHMEQIDSDDVLYLSRNIYSLIDNIDFWILLNNIIESDLEEISCGKTINFFVNDKHLLDYFFRNNNKYVKRLNDANSLNK